MPGSMTDNITNLPQMSNIGVPGQFVFRLDVRDNPGEYINGQFVFKIEKREMTTPGNCLMHIVFVLHVILTITHTMYIVFE